MQEPDATAAPKLRFHPSHVAGGRLGALSAERLYGILGVESDLAETARALRMYVQSERPPAVGAHHVTCSDEAEAASVEAFQRGFVRYLVPSLKFFHKAPLRTANLGARYEWGSVRCAEEHFAGARGAQAWKLIVLKLDAHAAVEEGAEGASYGRLQRYGAESAACGALEALLAGSTLPFADDLRAAFEFEGVDRLGRLANTMTTPEAVRALYAAAASARLQARRAMLDVQDHVPRTPTLYLIVPCVTLNRPDRDTEIVCGVYACDRRGEVPHDEYCGLGDRTERYALEPTGAGRVRLADPDLHHPRFARNHRRLVLEELRRLHPEAPAELATVGAAVREAAAQVDSPHPLARGVLKTALGVMLEVAPVPAALLLFGEGVLHIRHAARVHQIAREAEADEAARAVLNELRDEIDHLPPERAQHLVHLLQREYGT